MLRAIIVDDEELSVKRLKKILSESGEIEICQAFLNPLEAYEFVRANPIHIAFLDIFMPEIVQKAWGKQSGTGAAARQRFEYTNLRG